VLKQVAEGVLIHTSEFCQSNAIVVQGEAGVLLVDPGMQGFELVELADALDELNQPVVAAFATHPHWDHVLWHPRFGAAPRYGTARCAAAISAQLSNPRWPDFVKGMMPPDIADQVPLDGLGLLTALPEGTAEIPWEGPRIRILEHQAHAPGHAALLIGERRVLVAGDMLSDVLIPLLNVMGGADPVEDYLTALRLLEDVAADVDVFVPGHGSAGDGDQLRERIALDRAYVRALRDGDTPDDPRIGPAAAYDWVADVHERQARQLAQG